MRSLPAAIQDTIAGRLTSLTICWRIVRNDGVILRGTEHDRDITIAAGMFAGTYPAEFNITGSDIRSTADLSVDNLEVAGATEQVFGATFDVADIESGVLDGASVVVFQVDWQNPNDGQIVVRAGNIGAISRDTDNKYRAEVRGLMQKLAQQIGQNYSEQCNVVRFGDSRCGFDVASITQACIVTAVTSRKAFTAEIVDPSSATLPTALPRGGEVQWTSGDNSGFTREVKAMSLSSWTFTVELYEESAADIQVGDLVSVVPGCDRLLSTCRFVYDNIANFRGYGVFIPGALAIMRGNTVGAECQVPTLEVPPLPPGDPPPVTPPPGTDPVPDPPPVVIGEGEEGPLEGSVGPATFIIPANIPTWDAGSPRPDVTGVMRVPGNGDIIEISAGNSTTSSTAGTRGPLTIRRLNGSGSDVSEWPVIRGARAGVVIIRRVNPSVGGFVYMVDDCHRYIQDYYVGVGSHNFNCGVRVMQASNATASNRDRPAAFHKFHNLSDRCVVRYLECTGGWQVNPATRLASNGIGILTNDQHIPRSGGRFQEDITIEFCYFHHLSNTGVYFGPNYQLGCVPLRNCIYRFNRSTENDEAGMKAKSWWQGTNLIYGNYFSRVGLGYDDPPGGAAHGIAITSSTADCFDNWMEFAALGPQARGGIVTHIVDGPPRTSAPPGGGYGVQDTMLVRIWNNVVIGTGRGEGIWAGGANGDGLVESIAQIFNNTVVGGADEGIKIGQRSPNSWIRNNVAVGNAGGNIDPGPGSQSNNLTGSDPDAVFVDPDNGNYQLLAASLASGTVGVDIAALDFLGATRTAGTADKGAYERA